MSIDRNAAGSLLEKFKAAQDVEGTAITVLHDAMKGGVTDDATLLALTDHMTEAHNKKMDIWDQLENCALIFDGRE